MAIIEADEVISYDGQWLEDGQIQVRQITRLFVAGEEISKRYHRYVVDVGDDVSNQPQIVKDVAQGLHTAARATARALARAAEQANVPDSPGPPVDPGPP